MPGRVEGKVALVTGAARGQGRSHAVRLAQEGADVIAVDVCAPIRNVGYPAATPEDLAETVRQVEAFDRRAVSAQVDIRNAQALKDVVDAGVSELGRLDVIVANAGIVMLRSWDEVTAEMWSDTIDVNLTGTWNTVLAGVEHLIAAGGGSIIAISSVSGLKGTPFHAPYVASKHGVTGLARGLASELAEHHIRVNSVHPCGVDTPMVHQDPGNDYSALFARNPRAAGMFTNMLPVGRLEPEDISNAVLFLASDESRYVTALAMTVDAGQSQY